MDTVRKSSRILGVALAAVLIAASFMLCAFAPATAKDEVPPRIQKLEYEDNTVKYTYHNIVTDADKTIEVQVSPASLATFGLEVVAEEMFDLPLEESPINPNSIIVEGGKLYIDFTDKIYESNFGTAGEATLLESIAGAYLDNLPDVNEIYYSVEGKDYTTGHFELSKDIPFETK